MTKFKNSKQYIDLMLKDKKIHIVIIALFVQQKGYAFDNYEQVNRFIRRYTRAAKELDCYEVARIKNVMRYVSDEADYKWTLETVLKFIDEDIPKLQGEEPIITLKSGEQVYETDKIKQLEKDGKVFYKENKWHEK